MAVRDSVDVSQDVPTKHINHQPSSIDSCPRVSTLRQSLIPPSVDFVSHDKQPKYNSRSTRGHSIIAETISRRRQRTPACLDLFSDAIQRRKRRTSALDTFGRYRGSMSEQGYFNRVRDDLVGLLKLHPPIENFRRAVKLVQILLSVSEIGYQKQNEQMNFSKFVTFTEYAAKEDASLKEGLTFDPTIFKANKELRMTTETKSILLLPPKERTERQLVKVLFALHSIQSFAEYPVRMQKKLIRVGWYEGHPGKRIIIREGHPPHAFYFVLSGSAVVKIIDQEQNVARTLCFLKRGESFGELAILHDAKRQSTVISRENIELLCISREDFIDIFMASGGVKNIHDPDHMEFISSLEFLNGWPIELLPKYPKNCVFHFFRRGAVLIRDSNYSDWIYIVKSGSCQVLKKLKRVKSQLTTEIIQNVKRNGQPMNSIHRLTRNVIKEKLLAELFIRSSSNPEMSAINRVEDAQQRDTTQIHLQQAETTERPLWKKFDNGNTNLTRTSVRLAMRSQSYDNSKRQMHFPSHYSRRNIPIDTKDDSFLLPQRKVRSLRHKRYYTVSGANTRTENDFYSFDHFFESVGDSQELNDRMPFITSLKRQTNTRSKRKTSSDRKEYNEGDDLPQTVPNQKLTIIDEAAKRHQQDAGLTEADLDPCFVQVALLEKGDVFGLESTFCDNQPSLSLVSNGAECIMILKKYYLNHCSEKLKLKLRKIISPYPNDAELQSNLQDKVNWDAFRIKTLKAAVNDRKKSKLPEQKSL